MPLRTSKPSLCSILTRPTLQTFCLVVAMGLLTGCRTPVTSGKKPPAFFPPDKDNARLQFLTSLSRPEDFEKPPSALYRFLVGEAPPKRPIMKPYGIALQDQQLFVCDTVVGLIHHLNFKTHKWDFFRPDGAGRLGKVINLDIAEDGTRYVTDTKRGQVMVYDANGNFTGALGSESEMKPTDVKVHNDRVYVSDLKTQTVRVYLKASGAFSHAIPKAGTEEKEQLLFAPTNIDIGPQGDVYVSDSGAFRVQQYTPEGAFVRSYGKHGDTPGCLARNKGVAVDPEGRVYVVDAAFQNTQIFDPDGRLLLHFGDYSAADQGAMNLPAAILIDEDHNALFQSYVAPGFELDYVVLVTNQYGGFKVNAYGFIHKK